MRYLPPRYPAPPITAIGTAIVGTAALGGTGAYKAGVSPNSPPAVRSALSGYVRGVDASIAKTKAGAQRTKEAGKAVLQHPATQTLKSIAKGTINLAGNIADNAANRPIRTGLGAATAAYAVHRIRKRAGMPGKLGAAATGLGAIGGAAAPLTGMAVGGVALAGDRLSASRKEKVIVGGANAAGRGVKGIFSRGRGAIQRKTPPKGRGKK